MTATTLAGCAPAAASAAVSPASASASTGQVGPPPPHASALTWLEAAVVVLNAARRPLRAREIVEHAQRLGCLPASRTQTPWQSVNRDLHAAIRRGDTRVVAGPGAGQFCASGVTAVAVAAPARQARRRATVTVPRLPIEPLAELVEARGGLRSCGIRHRAGETTERARWVERLLRGYLRSRRRGWTSIYDADELSVKALGLHPSQVWGDGWWDAIEEAESVVAEPLADPLPTAV